VNCAARENALGYNANRRKMRAINGGILSVKGIEDRFLILGYSNLSRLLLICHCEKESGNLIRIISARKAAAKERKLYKGKKL